MRLSLASAVVALPLILAACSQRCIVVDSQGMPVENATVYPVSMSADGGHVQTDLRGIADVDFFMGGPYSVRAERAGYLPTNLPLVGRKFPVVIILHRDPKSSSAAAAAEPPSLAPFH